MKDPLNLPPLLEIDSRWFDISSIDRDNLKQHLASTPAVQANLSQLCAEAGFWERTYKALASRLENDTYLNTRDKTVSRLTAKSPNILVQVDPSDDYCWALAALEEDVIEYQDAENLWRHRRESLEGLLKSIDTKTKFCSSLAGITRSEIEISGSLE